MVPRLSSRSYLCRLPWIRRNEPGIRSLNTQKEELAATATLTQRPTYHSPAAWLVVVVIALLVPASLRSANKETNLQRFQDGARAVGDSLMLRTGSLSPLCFRVVDHPAGWIVEQGAVDAATARNVTVNNCAPPFRNDVLIAITDVGVTYVPLSDDDFLRRDIRLSVSASLPTPAQPGSDGAPSGRTTERIDVLLHDTIEAVRVSELESPAYSFTVGNRIERTNRSFWDTVAEPAVVIGTSVVMVVLLFTTRSE
jgi:hypothetical protein